MKGRCDRRIVFILFAKCKTTNKNRAAVLVNTGGIRALSPNPFALGLCSQLSDDARGS